jgi:hypothetical protein
MPALARRVSEYASRWLKDRQGRMGSIRDHPLPLDAPCALRKAMHNVTREGGKLVLRWLALATYGASKTFRTLRGYKVHAQARGGFASS